MPGSSCGATSCRARREGVANGPRRGLDSAGVRPCPPPDRATPRDWSIEQERFWKNAGGATRLAQCRTLPDLAAAQSDLVRDNLQQLIDVTRRVAERSMQVADEAGKAIAAETKQAAERFRRAA